MSNWDPLAQRDIFKRSAADFEEAAYRLIAEQVIYYSDKINRATYRILDQYEKDFRAALDPVGINLSINRDKRYVVALPRYSSQNKAPISATLFALVLRRLYDEFARQGNITVDGEVFIDLIDFEEKFRLITNRDLPTRSDLEQTIRQLKRWGIARKTSDDEYAGDSANSFAIVIRPAIIDLLCEAALKSLDRWDSTTSSDTFNDQDAEENHVQKESNLELNFNEDAES